MADAKKSKGGLPGPFHVEYKIWLKKDGAIFGDGIYMLLSHIDARGSISWAAREMGMSYRAAWGKIKGLEKTWGVPLVITQVGGEAGGGARLTPEAGELMRKFRRLRQDVDVFIHSAFQGIFGVRSGL